MNKTRILPSLLILALLTVLSCKPSADGSDWVAGTHATVSMVQGLEMNTKHPEVRLLDIRTPEEYSHGSIKGAKNINFHDANFDSYISELDKSAPYLVFCKSGSRSARCAAKMKDMGFETVYDITDGYDGYLSMQAANQGSK